MRGPLLASVIALLPVSVAYALDDTKPFYIKEGYQILCDTQADLAAMRDNAVDYQNHSLREPRPTSCWPVPANVRVGFVDKDASGFIKSLQPDYRVRAPNGKLGWIPSFALRN